MELDKKAQLDREHIISGRQIRMARAALGWRVDDLAKKSVVQWGRIKKKDKRTELQVLNISEKIRKKVRYFLFQNNPYHQYKIGFCLYKFK